MQGLHLTADLHGCPSDLPPMTQLAVLRSLCLDSVNLAGLQAVGELFHPFVPVPGLQAGGSPALVGITGVVLLAESHLAVHTWPEIGAVTLDVYVCNFGADNTARAHTLMAALVNAFVPSSVERHALPRGRITTTASTTTTASAPARVEGAAAAAATASSTPTSP